MLERLVGFYEILDHTEHGQYPFHLPVAQSQRLKTEVDALLAHYTWLTKFSFDRDQRMWNMIPKHHYMWHLADEASHLNPRMAWCYSNEDFVGKVAVIGLSVRHAQAAAFRSRQLVVKYMLGLTLRLFHALNPR